MKRSPRPKSGGAGKEGNLRLLVERVLANEDAVADGQLVEVAAELAHGTLAGEGDRDPAGRPGLDDTVRVLDADADVVAVNAVGEVLHGHLTGDVLTAGGGLDLRVLRDGDMDAVDKLLRPGARREREDAEGSQGRQDLVRTHKRVPSSQHLSIS